MSDEPFLSVYGSVAVDQTFKLKNFPVPNESADVLEKKTTLGGTGTNVALAATKLGVPTAICAFVGNDFPTSYEGFMRGTGLIMDDFVRVEEYETAACFVMIDENVDQRVVFYQGPHHDASIIGKDLINSARRSKYVHFGTGDPNYYISLMEKIKGPKMAVDPSQDLYKMWNGDLLTRAIEHCDSVFCNDYEGQVMERFLGIGDVFSLNVENVIRTLGDRGSMARIGNRIYEAPVIKGGPVVDASGAGDSYRAGYYAGLYHGYKPEEAMVVGAAVASFVVEKVGTATNLPTWEMAMERAEKFLKCR